MCEFPYTNQFWFGFLQSDLRKEWLPTPVFLPGEYHGQRNLVDPSAWDRTDLNTAERLILPREDSVIFHGLKAEPHNTAPHLRCQLLLEAFQVTHNICVTCLQTGGSHDPLC